MSVPAMAPSALYTNPNTSYQNPYQHYVAPQPPPEPKPYQYQPPVGLAPGGSHALHQALRALAIDRVALRVKPRRPSSAVSRKMASAGTGGRWRNCTNRSVG